MGIFTINLCVCERVVQCTHLVVDEQLNGIVAPLNEDNLVGLAWDTIGEGGANARPGTGLQPHADSEGVHLW